MRSEEAVKQAGRSSKNNPYQVKQSRVQASKQATNYQPSVTLMICFEKQTKGKTDVFVKPTAKATKKVRHVDQ